MGIERRLRTISADDGKLFEQAPTQSRPVSPGRQQNSGPTLIPASGARNAAELQVNAIENGQSAEIEPFRQLPPTSGGPAQNDRLPPFRCPSPSAREPTPPPAARSNRRIR